jgi:F0F1-type ATP synthase delta subunit
VAHKAEGAPHQLHLPVLIFGTVEVRRLKRELEALEDYMRQAAIREPGKQPPLPRVSRLLEAVAIDNSLQLLQPEHRIQIKQFLEAVEKEAPNLHISFTADPSSAFTAKIVTWLRAHIHPYTLLEVGLQPTIAAGCVVRTNNKVFDFSLRERFADARHLLVASLQAADEAGVPVATTTPMAAVAPRPEGQA